MRPRQLRALFGKKNTDYDLATRNQRRLCRFCLMMFDATAILLCNRLVTNASVFAFAFALALALIITFDVKFHLQDMQKQTK